MKLTAYQARVIIEGMSQVGKRRAAGCGFDGGFLASREERDELRSFRKAHPDLSEMADTMIAFEEDIAAHGAMTGHSGGCARPYIRFK